MGNHNDSVHCPIRIVIVGSGLAALSTALSLQILQSKQQYDSAVCRPFHIVLLEKDASFSSRSDGYGLTLQYHPKGVLQQLGILNEIANHDCPSRSHYLLKKDGTLLGYYGNAFSGLTGNHHGRGETRGYGQRGNLRVPRQTVRKILLDKVLAQDNAVVYWNHHVINVQRVQRTSSTVNHGDAREWEIRCQVGDATTSEDNTNSCTILYADWLIGADGIRSSIVDCILPNDTASFHKPRSIENLRIILGIAEYTSNDKDAMSLLSERGFYTLSRGHRLFVMPYSAPSFLNPEIPRRYMWQLSFVEDSTTKTNRPNVSGRERQLLYHQEAIERCHDWHAPVLSLIQSTPVESIWSAAMADRDPQAFYQAFSAKISQQPKESVEPVLIVGDALHAMSCFKGQGAHQALLDGLCVAKWLGKWSGRFTQSPPKGMSSTSAVVKSCTSEMVQRSAPIVQASREAAYEWHCNPRILEKGHTFAGVPDHAVDEILRILHQHQIKAGRNLLLDDEIAKILRQHRLSHTQDKSAPSSPSSEWTKAALEASRMADGCRLRELSWHAKDGNWLRNLRDQAGNTCLHLVVASTIPNDTPHPTSARASRTVQWLVIEAGLDVLKCNNDGHTPRDLAKDSDLSDLLQQLEDRARVEC